MRFYIERLGCPKNDVDADYISGRLLAEGHSLVDSADEAEAVLVNTCGFILPARQESIGELLRYAELKKNGQLKKVIATGCLSQKHSRELLDEIPELDGACGLGALDDIASVILSSSNSERKEVTITAPHLRYLAATDRHIDLSTPYAYLKISDGCDRKCSYCIIPQMRGSFRSRPIEEIVSEAHMLAEAGKRELILVSQEATLYGADTGKTQLLPLLDKLQEIEGIEWIRLLYLHPQMLDSELIDYLSSDTKTLPYYDLPLQHINDGMLKRMRRQVRRAKIESILTEIREKRPEATIRTTFIIGFPGETSTEFGELCDFAADFKFDHMGAFAFSSEEGTAAALMPDRIDEQEVANRLEVLAELQDGVANERNQALIGSPLLVLLDSVEGDTALGRTAADCPDIDQNVRVVGENLQSGEFLQVIVEAVDGEVLMARPESAPARRLAS